MRFEILTYPNQLLKTKAATVKAVDSEIKKILDDMLETMRFSRGVGLAAPQVGIGKRLIVMEVPEFAEEDIEAREPEKRMLFKLVNPEIISSEGEQKYEEGCLSVPGVTAEVKRAARVIVRAMDENGKAIEINACGLLAVALQHEIDHLDGILFIDRLSRLKRQFVVRRYKRELASLDTAL
ncbi:MAG: peptide deformylase [Deltaproteobacteria bacterium]